MKTIYQEFTKTHSHKIASLGKPKVLTGVTTGVSTINIDEATIYTACFQYSYWTRIGGLPSPNDKMRSR